MHMVGLLLIGVVLGGLFTAAYELLYWRRWRQRLVQRHEIATGAESPASVARSVVAGLSPSNTVVVARQAAVVEAVIRATDNDEIAWFPSPTGWQGEWRGVNLFKTGHLSLNGRALDRVTANVDLYLTEAIGESVTRMDVVRQERLLDRLLVVERPDPTRLSS